MTDFSKDAKIFKALCDTKRLTILDYLKSGEKCACVLIENMNIGQSALSHENTLRFRHCSCKTRGKMDTLQPK